MEKHDPIISFITEEKILDEETLKVAVDKQRSSNQSLISILKKQKLLDENQLARVIAAANKIEFINLSPEMVETKVARLVSYKTASRHTLIPFKKEKKKLYIAMSSPLNLSVRDHIEMKTGYKVIPVAAMPNAIKQAIHYHFMLGNVSGQTTDAQQTAESDGKDMTANSDEVMEDMLDESTQNSLKISDIPVTEVVSSIMRGAIDAGASDIHIEPCEKEVRVRYRVDGILQEMANLPSSARSEIASHIKVMADMDISERRIPQDGHMSLPHGGKKYDLRISSLPSVGGEKIVIRILDQNTDKWSLDKIAPAPQDNQAFRKLVKNPYGLILLTGPTGSGKTTTLYSILQLLNTPGKNIVTVEDPVEYYLQGITQVQVKPVAGLTFASTLRSVLRQDPDIILVGEIRDLETAEIAVSAALTGHLVLSTLHTNDAAGAISRLINIGIPPFLVASAVLGTAAQRLVRKICTKCKKPYTPPPQEIQQLQGVINPEEEPKLYKGTGCNNCFKSGYSGRSALYEILSITSEIRKLIVESGNDSEIKKQAVKDGMKTLRISGLEYALKGTTTIEELSRLVDMRVK